MVTRTNFVSKFIGGAFVVLGCVVLGACGAASSTTAGSYTSQTISGTLSDVGISGGRFRILTGASNYMVWFQNVGSQRVYFADVNGDGTFALSVETASDVTRGDRFIAFIVKKDPLSVVGTITGPHTSTANSAVTGMIISGAVTGLQIGLDRDNYNAVASANSSNFRLDSELKTRLVSGRPSGQGNAGKGSDSVTSNLNVKNTLDQDEDGLPDIVDSMNDGSILDNRVTDNIQEGAKWSDSVHSVMMFVNLKVQRENQGSSTMVTDNSLIIIQVNPRNASAIDSVVAYLVNTNYATATVDDLPGGYTAIDTWPARGTAWRDVSKKLYKVSYAATGAVLWKVALKPENNAFKPGDLVLLKVTLKSGKIEYYLTGINFKFQTLPTLTGVPSTGTGTNINPYQTGATGNVTLTWNAPTDETGSALAGIDYSFEVFYYDSVGNQIGERQVVFVGTGTSGTLTSAVIDRYSSSSPSPASIQVDVTARYPFGDNSANIIKLKRSTW